MILSSAVVEVDAAKGPRPQPELAGTRVFQQLALARPAFLDRVLRGPTPDNYLFQLSSRGGQFPRPLT